MHKRIAIIYPTKYVVTVPSLVLLVHLLIENNYEVDIFHSGKLLNFKKPKLKEYTLKEQQCGTMIWKINFLFNWIPRIFVESIKRNYSVFIGVDQYGLIIAGILGKTLQIPYLYFSLELLFFDEIRSKFIKILKRLETFFNRSAFFTIIQDIERAELLRKENHLPISANIVCLPNSSTGEVIGKKSHYLRSKFDISSERVIILYSGTISPEFMPLELVKMVVSWKENYVLILHSGRSINYDNEYVKEVLKFIDNKVVFLDTTFISENEYEEMISSADIGLALYKTTGSKNIYYIGLSSGKIARYLKCGLPVVVSNLPSLARLIDEYQCGIFVDAVEQLPIAIEKIISEYEFYSANAIHCFNDKYSFKKHFNGVLEQINSLGFNESGSDEI